MSRRRDIQILRGVSVVCIVFFHINRSWLPNGYLGVDAFFVVSGFVVTPLIMSAIEEVIVVRNVKPLFEFYKRRFFRLIPALVTTLSLFLLPFFSWQTLMT